MLVFVDEGNKLDHGGAPEVRDIVFDDIEEYLVKILGKQVPQNLILVRAVRWHRSSKRARVWDVKDVSDKEEAVVDQVDLGISQLLHVDDPVEPVGDHEGGPKVPEHLLGPAEAGAQLEHCLTPAVWLREDLHWAQTLHGHREVHQEPDHRLKHVEVIRAGQEDRDQVLVENLEEYLMKTNTQFTLIKNQEKLDFQSISKSSPD